MKAVIQRVSHANVVIENQVHSQIKTGLLVLVGIEEADTQQDIEWLASKITKMRIFDDENGVMNRSLEDISAEILIVSQFTLQASIKKGNRPSYIKAARAEIAIPIYEEFIKTIQKSIKTQVKTGVFGADMQINLCNSGPVTIIADSKNKE